MALAPVLTIDGAGVSSVGLGLAVALPDVHLGAAGAVLAGARVDVSLGWCPVLHVGLSVDELDVVRALSITVTSAISSPGSVGGVFRQAAILHHLDKVEGSVQPTVKLAIIHGKRELLVEEVEHHIVLLVRVQEVGPGANVPRVRPFRDKAERELVPVGVSVVSALPVDAVDAVNDAVCRAGGGVWAEVGVPLIAGVAVGGGAGLVGPAPVGVEDDKGVLLGA